MRLAHRFVLGILLYAALCAGWLVAGLDRLYDDLVFRLAVAGLPLLTHFPVGSSEITPIALHNQGYVIVLGVALALVAERMSWLTRLKRYSILLILVVAAHVGSMTIQLHLAQVLKFHDKMDVSLLVGWELAGLRAAFQLLFLFGLQIATFLLFVLTALWSLDRSPAELFGSPARPPTRRRPTFTRRRRFAAVLAGASILAAVVTGAWWLRERAPEHVSAHTYIAHMFLTQGRSELAERQYRAAIRGGSRDGRTWFNLISLMEEQGRAGEALRLTREARRLVTEPEWRRRFAR